VLVDVREKKENEMPKRFLILDVFFFDLVFFFFFYGLVLRTLCHPVPLVLRVFYDLNLQDKPFYLTMN